MFVFHFCVRLLLIFPLNSFRIPVINNTILKQGFRSNISTQILHGTCSECLCQSQFSSSIINCFPNETCQLFPSFPSMYRLEAFTGARLYFPQGKLPDPSECCMLDLSTLLSKLKLGSVTSYSVLDPRDVVLDNHGYLVTIEREQNYLDRFNPTTLTRLDHQAVSKSRQMSLTYSNQAYYIAPYNSSITVIDSNTLTVIANMNTSVSGAREIMFLENGQLMVLSAFDDNSLVFYNRTHPSSDQYSLLFRQVSTFQGPHGMWPVNDSFFYVTSYTDRRLYSFSATANATQWTETLIFATGVSTNGAARMGIDDCDRFWFAFETDVILIFDQQGNLSGNWTFPSSKIFDIMIAENYLMYFSDSLNNEIKRIDPQIQCFP